MSDIADRKKKQEEKKPDGKYYLDQNTNKKLTRL
jgi:hypothetical protein